MFEKEAEEYATRECCMTCNNINHFCKEKCECWTFAKKGAEFAYNKANKWHYVKDELPPLNTNVLVIHKWHRTPEVGKRITVFPNCSKWVWAMCCDRYRYTSDDKNVIAWKEITLPKKE